MTFKRADPVISQELVDLNIIVNENENKLNTQGVLLYRCEELQSKLPVIQKSGTEMFSVWDSTSKKYYCTTEVQAKDVSETNMKEILERQSKLPKF